ncbi:MAG: AAA family ATPase [Symploca sp. SIO2D2]|nr:AAA family ATPase [Symploca sp. SIO2D2]
MKLEAVNIQSFRSIQDVTLEDCGEFNVIVGKNNAGKSNIILAINIFFEFFKKGVPIILNPPIGELVDYHNQSLEVPISITVLFQLLPDEMDGLIQELRDGSLQENMIFESLQAKITIDEIDPALRLAVTLEVASYPEQFAYIKKMVLCKPDFLITSNKEFVFSVFNINSKDAKKVIEKIPSAVKQKYATNSYKGDINRYFSKEDFIPTYALKLIKLISETKVLYLPERREPVEKREASQLLDLKVKRGGTKKLSAIQDTVSAMLGVDIDAFRPEQTNSGEDLEAELDVDNFLVQVNGAGIREALRLIIDYELNQPNILLVEEPEVHLHPALETSMMRYLKTISQECQVFITTHSTNFLDTAEMRNVYLASRNNATTIQLINVKEAAQSISRELGIRLSSLFMFDRLVFVEGKIDEQVFREWASTCGVNLAQASVGFVPMGGVRNLAYFSTEATINFLTKRRVSIHFILDRDEREDAEVQRLSKKLGAQSKLVVLNKRELENYLLSPRAIAKFIQFKHQLVGSKENKVVEIAEIEQAIDTCAEQLKDVAIGRRVAKISCPPIYLNRDAVLNSDADISLIDKLKEEYNRQKQQLTQLEQKLETTVEEQTKLVESDWATKKRDLVPGDLLLDKVCQSFGVRFKKEKDSVRLASFMEKSEIDLEITEILDSFV